MRQSMGYFRWTAPGSKTLLLAVLLVVSGLFLHAQEYRGTIYGAVADPNGAMVPGAVVTAAGPQQTYHATANSKGEFVIPFVELGVYTVSVYAPGFGTEKQSNIHIDVAAKIELKFTLKVGSTAESITVSDNAVGLNMADASGGTVMDPEKIQNLPMNGRQVYQMLSLTPGTKFTSTIGPNGDSGSRGWDETNAYSINGQSGQYNQITLNGAPISTQGGGGAGAWNIAPNLDAVEEFKVMTNTYDAAYGREAGGTVNTVLKSGGNQFHGTAFDFWRNSILDANSFQFNQTNGHGEALPQPAPVRRHRRRPCFEEQDLLLLQLRGVARSSASYRFRPEPSLRICCRPRSGAGSVNLSNYLSANGVRRHLRSDDHHLRRI
jgi:hypothetical protein